MSVDASNATLPKDAIAQFYDEFVDRQIQAYIGGNLRIEAAIERVCGHITPATSNVLDIGCGIGWTSHEYAIRAPWINVLGIDISPVNVNIANRLFGTSRVRFQVSSLPRFNNNLFDVVALVDVYEHIPKDQLKVFHSALADCLVENGVVIITTPSPYHQIWLSKHNPSGLQIVDEIITLTDLTALADDLGATIVQYEYMGIWKSNDYVHTVIERNPKYDRLCHSPNRRTSLFYRINRRLNLIVPIRKTLKEKRRRRKVQKALKEIELQR